MFHSVSEILQDVIYIPATKAISDSLKEMQRSKTHMAVVVDQYGGTKGIVTLEDIIEELLGTSTMKAMKSFMNLSVPLRIAIRL